MPGMKAKVHKPTVQAVSTTLAALGITLNPMTKRVTLHSIDASVHVANGEAATAGHYKLSALSYLRLEGGPAELNDLRFYGTAADRTFVLIEEG